MIDVDENRVKNSWKSIKFMVVQVNSVHFHISYFCSYFSLEWILYFCFFFVVHSVAVYTSYGKWDTWNNKIGWIRLAYSINHIHTVTHAQGKKTAWVNSEHPHTQQGLVMMIHLTTQSMTYKAYYSTHLNMQHILSILEWTILNWVRSFRRHARKKVHFVGIHT